MNDLRRDGAESPAAQAASATDGTLVTVGNFDGVHRGHQAVLRQGVERARAGGLRPVVLTFHPHPAEVLGRGAQPVLTPLDRKLTLLSRISPELLTVVEPFTKELSERTPEQFVRELLLRKLGAREVVVGENFRFGRGRSGDARTLAELGRGLGFSARAAELRAEGDAVISSTRIRELIVAGEVGAAEQLLGRPHAVAGVVELGRAQARRLGVPSANLSRVVEVLPRTGVYAVLVDVREGDGYRRLGRGVANVGTRPTLERDGELMVEVHVLDFEGDLYGKRLRAHLVRRLRDEVKFSSEAELRERLERDKSETAAALAEREPDPAADGAWY